MKRLAIMILFIGLVGASAFADVISTDRFGYTGTTTRYGSLGDAQNNENPLGTTSIGNRDLSIYIVNGQPISDNTLQILASWWYSTDASGGPGYGNTRGNTGVGFIQLYDASASTLSSISMGFGDYNGTNYTSYSVSLAGTNSSTYARFSPFTSNTSDGGVFLTYALNLTATGLNGQLVGNVIEANNHPTGVTGTFSGIFQNTSSDPAKAGFYVFSLTLDMTNWAFDNATALTYPVGGGTPNDKYGFIEAGFQDSYFSQQVPEPSLSLLLGLGLGATSLFAWRRKK